MLDTVVEATGYHRKYALTVLRRGPPVKRPTLRRRGRGKKLYVLPWIGDIQMRDLRRPHIEKTIAGLERGDSE